ncbi:MAG: hypothetical protein LQ338_003090 [Usnochroma carphineum]|nr:MAG: hypothetical protein LQ338_003090 [Usnochroma carphineum]
MADDKGKDHQSPKQPARNLAAATGGNGQHGSTTGVNKSIKPSQGPGAGVTFDLPLRPKVPQTNTEAATESSSKQQKMDWPVASAMKTGKLIDF